MNRHQQGYTLIELMISLLLGLMMISGFGSLFVQTQKSSAIQRSLSYMMEDGRYILEVFGRELRRSGSLRNRLTAGGGADVVFTDDVSVLGSGMDFLAADYIRGQSNAVVLRYQLNNATELATTDPFSTNSACERSISLTPGEDPAVQEHVVTLYFYVAFDTTTNSPVLYCRAKRRNLDDPTPGSNPTSTAEPLLSNVQQLLITYGVDTDADNAANYYVDAVTVPNWQQVVVTKLSVVLRSDDDNLTESSIGYTIDGVNYPVTDKRLYRVFSTTIAFRNKI